MGSVPRKTSTFINSIIRGHSCFWLGSNPHSQCLEDPDRATLNLAATDNATFQNRNINLQSLLIKYNVNYLKFMRML
jgi:hypothetical protein